MQHGPKFSELTCLLPLLGAACCLPPCSGMMKALGRPGTLQQEEQAAAAPAAAPEGDALAAELPAAVAAAADAMV